jgi:hypothetical protein
MLPFVTKLDILRIKLYICFFNLRLNEYFPDNRQQIDYQCVRTLRYKISREPVRQYALRVFLLHIQNKYNLF